MAQDIEIKGTGVSQGVNEKAGSDDFRNSDVERPANSQVETYVFIDRYIHFRIYYVLALEI